MRGARRPLRGSGLPAAAARAAGWTTTTQLIYEHGWGPHPV
jgi:hypothetical protein